MSAPAGYSLVFADEFDTLSLSNSRSANANWYTGQAWGGGFGNAKLMPVSSTGSPFSIVNQGDESALRILMSRNVSGQLQSGLISNTFPDGSSTTTRDGNPYGYYETRLWLPEGKGIWPAFWSIERERLSATRDHVVEVDVMEHYGAAMPDRYTSSIHDWNWNGTTLENHTQQYQRNVTGLNVLATGWHTYGVEIRPDRMTFSFDGQAYWSTETPATLDTDPMFMINLAAGAGWPIDPGLDNVSMYVDYFRSYELNQRPSAGSGQIPSGIPMQGAAGTSLTHANADGSTTVARYDAKGVVASIKTTRSDGSSDTFGYTDGVLTSETQVHLDRSRDVFLSNIADRSYVAEHRHYDAAGRQIEAIRTRADGSTEYHFTLDTSTGMRVTDQYDAAGRLKSHAVVNADGSSDTFRYTDGTLTDETQVHLDGSRDVFASNISGKSYVAEHRSYDAAGRQVEAVRTRADGSTEYHFTLDTSTGVRVTDQYDAAGRLKSHAVVDADGSSDTFRYTDGTLTDETQVHLDGSRDVFASNISGKSYVAEHRSYDVAGRLEIVDRTNVGGSHLQTAHQSNQTLISTAGADDTFQSYGRGTYVFETGFGRDTILGLRAGNASEHDVIKIDRSVAADLTHLTVTAMDYGTVIQVGPNETITLRGIEPADLTSSNFLFA